MFCSLKHFSTNIGHFFLTFLVQTFCCTKNVRQFFGFQMTVKFEKIIFLLTNNLYFRWRYQRRCNFNIGNFGRGRVLASNGPFGSRSLFWPPIWPRTRANSAGLFGHSFGRSWKVTRSKSGFLRDSIFRYVKTIRVWAIFSGYCCKSMRFYTSQR